ncbi:hypothetical protein LINPERHAP2_LOCUS12518, partial [Linum perenne]
FSLLLFQIKRLRVRFTPRSTSTFFQLLSLLLDSLSCYSRSEGCVFDSRWVQLQHFSFK